MRNILAHIPAKEKSTFAAKLKRRITELEEDNDILKKASAYFAKNQKKQAL